MVAFIQNRNLEIYWKQTFKIFQFNENGLCICRLKSEHIILKKRQKNAPFMDDVSKTTGII